jgi:hypothetical protein
MSKYSDWRVDLLEVGNVDIQSSQPETEDEFRKEITAKKVKNKVVINPPMREAFAEIGGELLEVYILEQDIGALQVKRAREETKIAQTDMKIAKQRSADAKKVKNNPHKSAEMADSVAEEDDKWIQKATKGMRKDKPCTGDKFGSASCPPGSKRYNLAKTFKKMAKEENEVVDEYLDTVSQVKKAENKADRKRWSVDEACWKTHEQRGMKKKGGKMVPNCVPKGTVKKEEVEQIDEVSPPGWGHTKAEKEKTKPNKPKSKVGGSAAAFNRALDDGRFKGLPGDKTYKDKKESMFKLMWSMKKKGDKPHYKPGTDKKKKQYQKDD